MVANTGSRRGRSVHVGVALSATELCAAIQRPGDARMQPWHASLTPLNGDGTGWPGLADALRTLARDAGIADGRLTVALMSPLVEARGVELPPVSDAEIHQLLARGASRYFIAARGPQVVGAVRGARRSGTPGATRVAAAAPTRLLNAIHEAAAAAGWTVDAVIPAEAAWGIAASRWATRSRGATQLLVAHPDRTDLLHVENGRLIGLRRFRSGGADAALVAEAFKSSGAGALAAVGNPDARRELTRQLAALGITVEAPESAMAEVSEQPALLAAAFAAPTATPSLVTDAVRAKRAEAVRHFTTRIAIAASIIAVLGGALELWGARRELGFIRAQRQELKSQLSVTLVGSTSVQATFGQLTLLARAEHTAPRWSAVLTSLSSHVPPEAYLTGFRGRGDSLSVDGLAAHASRVIVALERAPSLVGARATGPIRRENIEDGPPMERFTISARVAPRVLQAPRSVPR